MKKVARISGTKTNNYPQSLILSNKIKGYRSTHALFNKKLDWNACFSIVDILFDDK